MTALPRWTPDETERQRPAAEVVTGFHARAVRKAFKNLIGVFENLGAAIWESEGVFLGLHTLTIEGDFGDFPREDGDIKSGGKLAFLGEPMGVFKIRLGSFQASEPFGSCSSQMLIGRPATSRARTLATSFPDFTRSALTRV